MSGLREKIKDEIQRLWLEGKSGPDEYADAAVSAVEYWIDGYGVDSAICKAVGEHSIGASQAHVSQSVRSALTSKLRSQTHD